jgi:hypothetical protein
MPPDFACTLKQPGTVQMLHAGQQPHGAQRANQLCDSASRIQPGLRERLAGDFGSDSCCGSGPNQRHCFALNAPEACEACHCLGNMHTGTAVPCSASRAAWNVCNKELQVC